VARRPPPAFAYDEEEPHGAPLWMVTYADLVTLLLALFVLLVATSQIEAGRFRAVLGAFRGADGIEGLPTERAQQAALLARLDAAGLGGTVEVEATPQGLRLAIADSVMFRPGEAALVGAAPAVLRLVAAAVTPAVGMVVVEGHTDDRPIATARYPSNWELSAARAAAVVRFLLAQPGALPAERYQASGHAEHRPRAPNATPAGRALNRRVEILLTTPPWPSPSPPPPRRTP
jgi:chemotaxis protein MotB